MRVLEILIVFGLFIALEIVVFALYHVSGNVINFVSKIKSSVLTCEL